MADRAIGSGEATEIAEEALRELLTEIPHEVQQRVLQRVGGVIAQERQREREQCVGVCRRRADLWRHTSQSRSSLAIAREEARARANEATYLADLLVTGRDLADLIDRKDADA
jgi:hypothetical protein